MVPTAEETAKSCEILAECHRIFQDAVPHWRQLPIDDPERIVGHVLFFGFWGNVMAHYTRANSRLWWDAPLVDLAGFRQAWQSYSYHKHHALCLASCGGTYDAFLHGNGCLPPLLGAGQVAEACAFVEKLSSIYGMIADEAGVEVTSASMDEMRSTTQTALAISTVCCLTNGGLRSQAATILHSLGLDEWQSECRRRCEEFWFASPLLAHFPVENGHRAALVHYGCWCGGFAALRCCPQSEATKQLARAILNGTASDGPSGVDTLTAAQGSCRETYLFCGLTDILMTARDVEG